MGDLAHLLLREDIEMYGVEYHLDEPCNRLVTFRVFDRDIFNPRPISNLQSSIQKAIGKLKPLEKLRIFQYHEPEGSGGKACHW